MSSTPSSARSDLPGDAVPLLVVPIRLTSNFLLFGYGHRLNHPQDQNPTPYLIQREIPGPVPDYLCSFVTPYSVASNSAESDPALYPRHLRYMTVINSTQSGTHKSSEVYFSILLPLLKRLNMSHVYVATSSRSSILNHACSFSDPSTVVLLTGDTSISEFINCLPSHQHGSNVPLTLIIIPTGTGNALAMSSGLTSIQKAVSRMFLGSPQPLANFQVEFPIGTRFINTPYSSNPTASAATIVKPQSPPPGSSTFYSHFVQNYLHDRYCLDSSLIINAIAVLSWAAHASLVADSDSPQLRRLGEARFRKAAEQNMSRSQRYRSQFFLGDPSNSDRTCNNDISLTYLNPFHNAKLSPPLTLPLPHKLDTDSHGYILFSLVSNIEKTYKISPNSRSPSDLTLHLVHTDYSSNDRLSQMMMAPYTPNALLGLGKDVQYFALSYKDRGTLSKYSQPLYYGSSNSHSPSLGNPSNQNSRIYQIPPIAAELYPQETDPKYTRWCVDGALLNVPKDMGPVKVRLPSYNVRGWSLFMVT